MGMPTEGFDTSPAAIRSFTRAILEDLRALEKMLADGWIEEGVRRFGAEQELFLVGKGWRPEPLALRLLERLEDSAFTTELGLFNLEVNTPPLQLGGECFREFHALLDRNVTQVRDAARAEGGEAVLTGILPTLTKSDLSLSQMTPNPRYHVLNTALTRSRGEKYRLRIEGADEVILEHDSVMMEACNASCQVHLQVGAEEFPRLYNTAQLVLAPVLAASGNSPLLFGRRLWAETRIALFQQSIDTRAATPYVRNLSPRVRFGDGWVKETVTELFEEDLTHFRVLMAGAVEEDPLAKLDAGVPPDLGALRLFNSTIYRWMRPCYGIWEGRPHLRIECRILPSGPSTLDEAANAAFWIGLMLGASEKYGDPAGRVGFADVKSNFLAAAHHGLNTSLLWLDGERIPAGPLILDTLLPLARQGLFAAEVNDADVARYLGVVEERVGSGRTGSEWMLRSLSAMEGSGARAERLAALTAASTRNQQEGTPVHRWELARLADAGDWLHSYLRVEQYMNTHPITVHEDEAVDLVAFIMDRTRVRYVPVEDHQHRLVGLVSHQAVLRYAAERHESGPRPASPVSDIMERNPPAVTPETPTLEAMDLMREKGLACLPVIQDRRLVGLVTERDFIPVVYDLLEERLREG